MNWTNQWPTEPGEYWFYGWCWGSRARDPQMHFVRASRTGPPEHPGLVVVTDGHFLWQSEGGLGLWCPAKLPDAPDVALQALVAEERE